MKLLIAFLAGFLLAALLFSGGARAATPMTNRSPVLVFRPVTVPALVDRLPGPSPTRSAVLGITTELQSERRPVSGQTTRRSLASWYCCTAGYGPSDLVAAAGPALRTGAWRGRSVTVCADRCVTVRLVDWCRCQGAGISERVIDLQPGAFERLAPLSRGVIRVTVGGEPHA